MILREVDAIAKVLHVDGCAAVTAKQAGCIGLARSIGAEPFGNCLQGIRDIGLVGRLRTPASAKPLHHGTLVTTATV